MVTRKMYTPPPPGFLTYIGRLALSKYFNVCKRIKGSLAPCLVAARRLGGLLETPPAGTRQYHWMPRNYILAIRERALFTTGGGTNKEGCKKGDSAFPWISAQPLLEPLLNMHTTSYMSVITYVMIWSYLILRAIPAINETNALREVS